MCHAFLGPMQEMGMNFKHLSIVARPQTLRNLYPNLTQMGQYFYHGMLMPFHDSMPSFINFRRIFDLLEFKNQVSQYLRPSDGGRVFEIHSHFLHGTYACNQGHRFDFSTHLYALEHVHVVKI